MDFKKVIDIKELKKTLTRLENIAALSLVLFFFFPWVSMGPFSFNGFGLLGFPKIGAFTALVIALIPIMGLLVVAMRPICQHEKILKILKFVAGGLPIAAFIISLIDAGGDFFQAAGLGFYLTLIAGVLIILGTLDKVQLPDALPALDNAEEAPAETTQES